MTRVRLQRAGLGAFCAALMALSVAPPAQGAADDPLFVYTPAPHPPSPPIPPPTGYFEGLCGLAVDSVGNFYVSDYYHRTIDIYEPSVSPSPAYLTQTNLELLYGSCGLALDAPGDLYLNDLHHDVRKFTPSVFPPSSSTSYGAAATIDAAYATGVAVDPATDNVYVDERTHVAVYEPSGAPVEAAGAPLRIGAGVPGSLGDGYGVAVSAFPATAGYVYVPDAADDTVKVYDPAVDVVDPIAVIDGHDTPSGAFVSLRDSVVAVDRVSGNVYVVDNLQPGVAEEPEAAVYVFGVGGVYLGRLKYNIVDGEPPGLAVDNSALATQGRVYVTSGNTEFGSVYAYPPGAQTAAAVPARLVLGVMKTGTGGGSITSDVAGIDCDAACEADLPAGAKITLAATPDESSTFTGWSGGGCSGIDRCTVTMSRAISVSADFKATAWSSSPATFQSGGEAEASEVTQKGVVRLGVSGKLSPHRLPRSGAAPIAVSVNWKIATTDGSAVPQLKKLGIEINRNGRLDFTGLPICPYERIQTASSARALAACRSALVGDGSFSADIALKGQEPYSTRGRLLVFNGESHGRSVLLGQLYSPHPFATSFVITFAVDKLGHGPYGTALTATLPKALASWGNLTAIDMKLSRRYTYRGERHSFISGSCPAPTGFSGAVFPLSRTSFDFAGGTTLSSTLTDTCKVR
jgi:hypothetical protein